MFSRGIPDDLSAGGELSLHVVGVADPNEDKAKMNRQSEVAFCGPGELVELRREPNKHIRKAVAVYSARGHCQPNVAAVRAGW